MIRNEIGISATPAQVVLMQELDRFNFLLKKMLTTLKTLQKALLGEVGMSSELEDVLNALFNGGMPPSWRRFAPATLMNLSNWLDHFQGRFRQYDVWVTKGEPKVMWLSGL